jgi:outer membrane protein TolC
VRLRAFAFGLALACGAVPTAARADDAPHLTLSIAQALELALRNNLDYRAALADVRAAQARVIEAGAALLPTLDLSDEYQHAQSAENLTLPLPNRLGGTVDERVFLSATDTNYASAVLQYVIYDGGRNHATIGVAAAGYSAAQSELSAVRDTVRRDTTAAYFNLVRALEAAAIADRGADVAAQDVTTAQQLLSAGTAAKADVLRQQVALADARSRQIAAHNSVSLANAALANILNVDDLSSTIEPSEPLDQTAPDVDLGQALKEAQAGRPELRAAADAEEIAKQTLSLARAGSLPSIALGVQEASIEPSLLGVSQPQLTFTLEATWRLFDGGLTRGKVAEAEAEIAKANINLAQLRNAADLEVRHGYFDYVAARAQVDAARAAVAFTQESLRLSRLRYENGAGTSLELADALLSDTQARTNLVDALVNVRTSYAALQRAIGL